MDSLEVEPVDIPIFEYKQEKLGKTFLELEIAIATAGKAEQHSLIKGFAEAAF